MSGAAGPERPFPGRITRARRQYLCSARLPAAGTGGFPGFRPRPPHSAAVAACGALAACGGGAAGGTGSGPALTLYSGQHPQTTAGAGEGVREARPASRSTCAATTRTRWPTRSPPRARAPPRTCSSPRTPRRSNCSRTRACCPRSSPATLGAGARQVQLAAGRLGRGVGPGQRDRLQPEADQARPSCPPTSRTSPTRSTRASWRWPRRRPTSSRSSPRLRAAYGKQATLSWLEAIKANAAGHIYPDNETLVDKVNRGQATFGVINQYYWYRLRAELGAGRVAAEIAHFAPRDPGYVIDVSGVGILKSSKHQAQDQKFVAFLLSPAGPADHRQPAEVDQLRVPDRVRGDRAGGARPRCPSSSRTASASATSVTGPPRSR